LWGDDSLVFHPKRYSSAVLSSGTAAILSTETSLWTRNTRLPPRLCCHIAIHERNLLRPLQLLVSSLLPIYCLADEMGAVLSVHTYHEIMPYKFYEEEWTLSEHFIVNRIATTVEVWNRLASCLGSCLHSSCHVCDRQWLRVTQTLRVKGFLLCSLLRRDDKGLIYHPRRAALFLWKHGICWKGLLF
jgi:hypothetical protein